MKQKSFGSGKMAGIVAPHAGAWIETAAAARAFLRRESRPPCGGVD